MKSTLVCSCCQPTTIQMLDTTVFYAIQGLLIVSSDQIGKRSATWQKRQAPFLLPSMVEALMISSISGISPSPAPPSPPFSAFSISTLWKSRCKWTLSWSAPYQGSLITNSVMLYYHPHHFHHFSLLIIIHKKQMYICIMAHFSIVKSSTTIS